MSYLKYTMLYEFSLGTNVWRYTSNHEDVIDEFGEVWEACAISDDGVSTSGEVTSDSLTITAPIDIAPARLFAYSPPSRIMDIRRLYAEFQDKPESTGITGTETGSGARLVPVMGRRVNYVGEISQCSFPEPGSVAFPAETISASMEREGLRLGWQRQCPHAVYDPSTCMANKAANSVTTTILSVSGAQVVVASVGPYGSGSFNAGLLEFVHPVKGAEVLTIESQAGTTLTMFDPPIDLWEGMSVTIARGCDQTPASCLSFDNFLNYGGIKDLPGKSPFDGVDSPMF